MWKDSPRQREQSLRRRVIKSECGDGWGKDYVGVLAKPMIAAVDCGCVVWADSEFNG
jgi:hypothetical protein